MHNTVPFSPQDISGITLQEAGKAALQELSAKYPYFLPLKVVGQLLQNEASALQELPYIYGVNPVVLHYLAGKVKVAPQPPAAKKPVIVGWEPTAPKDAATPEKDVAAPETETPAEEPTDVEASAGPQPAVDTETPASPAVETASDEVEASIQPESIENPEAPAPEPTEMEVVAEATAEAAESAVPATPEEQASPTVDALDVQASEASEMAEFPEINAPEVSQQPSPQPASPDIADASAPDEPMIQPLYTKDYFKHQGVSMEDAAENPFEFKKPSGNDLMVMRSFGEWLRFFHSKKVKADEEQEDKRALKAMWQKGKLAAALEEEDEEIPEVVFEMAVKSISHEGNPATETMAKIYLGQGKWEKAIGVYEQLQLRNPQKSTYFAEKIAAIEQQHRP